MRAITADRWHAGPGARRVAHQASQLLVAGSQDWINFLDTASFPRFLTRGEGPYLWDADGRRYIDLYVGSGAVILGHCHERQIAAVREHLGQGPILAFRHILEVEVAEWLHSHLSFAERCMFFKTGSEAANAALRVAMCKVGRPVALSLGYHGWLSPYLEGWPEPSGVRIKSCDWDLESIERTLRKSKSKIGAVIVSPDPAMLEPVFYRRLQEATRQAGAMFIMDEIKSGIRFRFPCLSTSFGLNPDIVLLSKALTNGFPMSALAGKDTLLGDADLFSVFSTFAAESVSLAATKANLALLEDGAYSRFEHASRTLFTRLEAGLAGGAIALIGDPTFFRLSLPDRGTALELSRRLVAAGILLHPFDNVMVSAAHDEEEILDGLVTALVTTARQMGLAD